MDPKRRKLYIKIFIIWLIGSAILFWHAAHGGGFKDFQRDIKASLEKAGE